MHSSGYAKVQNREGFGTASTQSFNERRRLAEQRRTVGRYQDAQVAQQTKERREARAFSARKLNEGSVGEAGETNGLSRPAGSGGSKILENIAKPDIKPHF